MPVLVHLVAAAKSLEILTMSASLLLMAAALFETSVTMLLMLSYTIEKF